METNDEYSNNLTKIYKYRSGDERDIGTISNNQIWVPLISALNDPCDLSVYCKDIDKNNEDEFKKFVEEKLKNAGGCLSFSTSLCNKRLWNYYTNGFKGFVAEYTVGSVVNALRNALDDKNKSNYLDMEVSYSDEKIMDCHYIFQQYKKNMGYSCNTKYELFFHKDKSWEDEKEYRFSVGTDFFEQVEDWKKHGGRTLENIVPDKIIVGYKMVPKSLKRLINYANKQKIKIQEYRPKYGSKCYDFELIDLN